MNQIETPKMSEILFEEFMKPLGISAYRLAKDIHVPVSRIQDILHDRRGISADTSIRLGLYFGVSERYFLNLQNDIDLRNAKNTLVCANVHIEPAMRAQILKEDSFRILAFLPIEKSEAFLFSFSCNI